MPGGRSEEVFVPFPAPLSLVPQVTRFRSSWSGIIVACGLGIAFYLAVSLVERVLIPWHVSIRAKAE